VGGPCPPLPAVGARAVSSARSVWCVSSCRAVFAFWFFSLCHSVASPLPLPLPSARCARAGRSAPCACARCSGTVPAAPRAAPPAAPPPAPRTGPVRTTATASAFHTPRLSQTLLLIVSASISKLTIDIDAYPHDTRRHATCDAALQYTLLEPV